MRGLRASPRFSRTGPREGDSRAQSGLIGTSEGLPAGNPCSLTPGPGGEGHSFPPPASSTLQLEGMKIDVEDQSEFIQWLPGLLAGDVLALVIGMRLNMFALRRKAPAQSAAVLDLWYWLRQKYSALA